MMLYTAAVNALQQHIASSDPHIRQLGYVVGEAVTRVRAHVLIGRAILHTHLHVQLQRLLFNRQ